MSPQSEEVHTGFCVDASVRQGLAGDLGAIRELYCIFPGSSGTLGKVVVVVVVFKPTARCGERRAKLDTALES